MNTVTNKIKINFFIFLLLGLAGVAQGQGQTFGNEWVNYSQTYYKIKVTRNGIHRLDYNFLNNAGLSAANPQKLQLFRSGKEVAIVVNGEADGRLDTGDYVEFYGERNDGKTDVELYQSPAYKVHDYYSLYTDTAAYFLTVSAANGKRMVNQNVDPANLTPETWHHQTRMNLFVTNYSRGIAWGESAMSWGDKAEGFFSEFFGVQGGNRNRLNPYQVRVDSLFNLEPTGPMPTAEIALVGTYYTDHDVTVSVIAPSGAERILVANHKFGPFDHVKLNYPVQFNEIGSNGVLTIQIKVNTQVPAGGISDLIRVAYVKVRYPRKNIIPTKDFLISLADSNKTTPSFLVFDNLAANSIAYDITDKANVIRTAAITAGSQRGFIINGSPGKQRKILITTEGKFVTPLGAGRRMFKQFNAAKAGFIIISHKILTKPVANYPNPVKAYADYRASAAGGKYDTLVLYTDQIYDQFHYGDRSPVAIRRLMQFLMATGSPQYLFLLGKGIETDFGGGNFRKNPNAYPVQDLVPTGGAPGSDIIFTADFQNRSFFPKVPTGRVSAVNAAEVAAYLDKVKQHEATPQNAEWRKNILHLGGGINLQEQNLFKNYLRSYENMAENPLYGAIVESISRTGATSSTSNINVSSQVNNGLSLITFFGHSSPSVLDIDIGYASNPVNNYNNPGKYPMILLNGCFSGNAFSSSTTRSFGEDWVLSPQKGAIGFIAHSATGYTTPLNIYSRNYYALTFTDPNFYGKSLGTINQEVVKRTALSGNEQLVATAIEMVMQADPAVVLIGPDKPDYTIKANSINIAPMNDQEPVTANSESFRILIPVKNLGKATQEPFKIKVTRNDQVEVISELYPPVFSQDTLTFVFSSTEGRVAGINTFKIMVDSENAIAELDEANNTVQFVYNFPATGSRPLMPYEYAIVNTQEVKLIGQASNILQASRLYTFELDTTRTFNSPAKQTKEVNASSLPTWTVNLLPNAAPKDSLVYYWRLRPKDVVASEDTIWGESSFRYIPASPEGWSQSQPGQFTKARTNLIDLNEQNRQWEFAPIQKNLSLRTAGGNITTDFLRYGIFINTFNANNGSCILNIPNILLAVFNDKTLETHKMPANLAPTLCGEAPQSLYYFGDLRQPQNREYLRTFLEAVPSGYYVAALTLNQVPFADFQENLKNAFRSVGSKLIDDLKTGSPFALIGRKGAAAGTAQEVTASGEDLTESIQLDYSLTGFGNHGTITSTLIGPAANWQTLFHTVRNNGGGRDRYTLKVTGLNIEGKNEQVIYANVKDRTLDLSAIDAKVFPYLQLSLTLADSVEATAPQLEEWRVHYTGVPEGVVRPEVVGLEKYNSFAAQAQKGKIDAEIAFQNISNHSFIDSLLARVTLIGANGFSKDVKLKAVVKDETVIIPYTFPTNNLSGNYTLRVTVNPVAENPMLRPEQYYFNNTLEVPFALNTNLHPVLDVVFDGRHILDGDIVSPNPLISMTLKDEDKYTFLKDPSHMEVYVKAPGASDFTVVNLAGNDIKYFAADKNNAFRLEYNPKNLPDGVYTLRVQGRDAAENKSGFEPYTINFEVINEAAVSHFYPYPNPFSSKTRFVFTLTGSTIPQDMKIQIMTVTGKVVREIMKDELGPLKIGNNISEFAWDGTDEFGDRLANGVYLYRVVMDTGTEEFKHRNTAGDKAFKKDYGKIYILR